MLIYYILTSCTIILQYLYCLQKWKITLTPPPKINLQQFFMFFFAVHRVLIPYYLQILCNGLISNLIFLLISNITKEIFFKSLNKKAPLHLCLLFVIYFLYCAVPQFLSYLTPQQWVLLVLCLLDVDPVNMGKKLLILFGFFSSVHVVSNFDLKILCSV